MTYSLLKLLVIFIPGAIVLLTTPLPAQAVSISNVRGAPASVSVYEKYEVKFDVTTSSAYPFLSYDENPPPVVSPKAGISVEGLFTSPSGTTLRQPAFYMTDVTRSGSGTSMVFEETNTKYWVVRFSPQQTGTYTVMITAKDSSGTTTIPVGSFNATTPVKKGFIKVSRSDPKYFEFSNGELYWPIGPAWGNDYAKYKDTGQNLERPWLGGLGIYSTNWARWKSSAELHGNEGIMTRLNFREHAPGHDLSYEIFYPEGYRMWLTTWMDDMFGPRLVAGKKYLAKLTYKIVNVTGSGGFVVKTSDYAPWGDPPMNEVWTSLANAQTIIATQKGSQDWHTVTSTFTANGNYTNLYVYLDNVTGGQAYVDEFSVKECLDANCTNLGGEVIRNPSADQHTYVEQRPAAYLDWQVEQGEQNGVFFKYVVHDKNDWIQYHLLSNGQFADKGDGYYQSENTKARWLLRQWYRYLEARWGYSTAVHSWELNNEGPPNDDPAGSGSSPHWRTAQAFARFFHDVNQNGDTADEMRWQLATTSFWCCWRPVFWGNQTGQFPDIDYADLHVYTGNPDVFTPYPNDMALWNSSVSKIVGNDRVGKPVMRAETGISSPGSTQPGISQLQGPNPGVWYHNLLWAQLNAGAMSDPNYFSSEHINNIDKESISRPFYNFVKQLDLNKGGYVDAAAVSSNAKIRVWGQKNTGKNEAHLWIQNSDHTWKAVMDRFGSQDGAVSNQSGTLTIKMNPNTAYDTQWWNTGSGTISSTQSLTSDSSGNLLLTISNLANDVAVKIFPRGGLPTGMPTSTPRPVSPSPTISASSCASNPARLTCFETWRSSFTTGTYSTEADLNNDGKVSLSDYEIWRRAYTGI